MTYDLVIKNAQVVRPHKNAIDLLDIGIKDGKITQLAPEISSHEAKEVFDAKNLMAFPGLVDAHMHTGIYAPLAQDALSESKAAAQGGVTSSLNYMRTGQYYLYKNGPYSTFFPEVLDVSKDNFYVDYAYHLAPIQYSHIDEIESLIETHGVTSFKIFMFYGSHGLHGKGGNQNAFLMTPEQSHESFSRKGRANQAIAALRNR
jgi:allantoinase